MSTVTGEGAGKEGSRERGGGLFDLGGQAVVSCADRALSMGRSASPPPPDCKPSTHYIYNQNKIDLPPYTQCLPPPSAFIHGDLWGSFIFSSKVNPEL